MQTREAAVDLGVQVEAVIAKPLVQTMPDTKVASPPIPCVSKENLWKAYSVSTMLDKEAAAHPVSALSVPRLSREIV